MHSKCIARKGLRVRVPPGALLRRRLPTGGLADSTLAMVFKAEGDEIICMDAFPSAEAAFASLAWDR